MSRRFESLEQYITERGFYEAAVEDGADIVFVIDYAGAILYHNSSVKDSLGHSSSELLGSSFFDYILPEMLPAFREKLEHCKSKPYVDNVEFRFKKHDGSFSYLEFNSVNLNHKEGIDGLILDCRDVNQRKKDAEELLRAQKAKEQFMANMSHEIRTPINGIAGMISLLAETNPTKEQLKYLNAIKTATENLKVIINDILDISVIESGKLKFEKVGFSIRHQLKSIIETFLHQAKEKNIYLDYHVENDVLDIVIGDPVRLNQILINLISNALKFTDKGGIRINISTNTQDHNRIYLRFDVTDTGIGIAEEKLETIFESFTQADESVTRKFGGTGLGLAISKQLVELQDGFIRVYSRENLGSTFTFEIPYEIGRNEDLIKEDNSLSTGQDEYESLSEVSILLVEDNDINRMYAANILKKWGCRFDTAENGYIATEKIKKNQYDIVLMDVQMPVMDGLEATRVIRKNFPEPKNKIPIIALTANVLDGDPEKYASIGMNGYLSKPFLPETLHKIISEQIKGQVDFNTDKSHTVIGNDLEYDLAFLKAMSNNDESFVKQIVSSFIESTPKQINDIERHLEAQDWVKLRRAAHQIKPSVKMLGMTKVHDRVNELENIEAAADKRKVRHLIDELVKYYTIGYKQLEAVLKELKS